MGFTYVAVLVSLIYLAGRHGVQPGDVNSGPYSVKILRHEPCVDQETGAGSQKYDIVFKAPGKSFLQSNMSLPYDFDDNLRAELNFSRFSTRGGWGPVAFRHVLANYCTDYQKTTATLFQFAFKAWGIENPSCPIKAGNYSLDLDTDLPTLPEFPRLPYGTYKITQDLSSKNPPVKLACNVWFLKLTSK